MEVRAAAESEVDYLAKLWRDGWHDAHAQITPAELVRLRTLESFRERLQAGLPNVWAIGPFGAPTGFFMIKDDELYQFYVAAQSRGTGVAATLMVDAEAQLAQRGVETAWLSCAIGNERAARFYVKCGWNLAGTMVANLNTSHGTFPFEVWRYEKALTRPA